MLATGSGSNPWSPIAEGLDMGTLMTDESDEAQKFNAALKGTEGHWAENKLAMLGANEVGCPVD